MSAPSSNVLITLVEAKPVMAAATAGLASTFLLGLSAQEAIVFGGTCALGVSLGDTLLTSTGFLSDTRTYLQGHFATFLDPLDFVGGAVGVLLINLAVGIRGRPLVVMTGVAAVSAGVAPKISSYLLLKSAFQTETAATGKATSSGGSSGPGGSSSKA